MKNAHVHVISGWFKTGSEGMADLAARLRKQFKSAIVTEYEWRYPDKIIYAIRNDNRASDKSILIGFSLGGNCTTWVAKSGASIDLLIAYDPSWLSPIEYIDVNVKRALWYHSLFYLDIFGHGTMTGNVERFDTMLPHMSTQYSERLHGITIAAIDKVLA